MPPERAGRARAPARSRPGKRLFDLLVAGLALAALSVVMLVIAILIRLTSPGPALFGQVRVGQHGRLFCMYKFRTMQAGCSDGPHRAYVTHLLRENGSAPISKNSLYKLEADPRVTRLGAALRRSSLDELPQLFNVLRGDMSLVGPRPMLPWEVELLPPGYQDRFTVPAGMTGLWQVSGRSRLTMKQALDLDVEYARTASFALDVFILVRTASILVLPRGRAL